MRLYKASNRMQVYVASGFLGFRIGRWWIKVKDTRKRALLFSERNGSTRTFQIGWIAVSARKTP